MHQAAGQLVFAAAEVARLGVEGVAVHQIPVDDRLDIGLAEPDGVEVFEHLGLNILGLAAEGIVAGEGDLGDLEGAAQRGEGVEHAVHIDRVELLFHHVGLVVYIAPDVILEADRVDACALEQGAFNLHEVGIAVVEEVLAEALAALVADQLVHREMALGHLEGALHEQGIDVHGRDVAAPVGLVGHFPAMDAAGVALGALGHALVELLPLRRLVVLLQPFRLEVIVVQAVRLGGDAVFLAVFQAEIGRGAAVHSGRVLRKARLALLRLERVPVEGHCGHVEVLLKHLAVGGVLLLGFKFVDHEDVRAVFEIVRLLGEPDGRLADGGAVFVLQGDRAEALAAVFDAGLRALGDQTGVVLKGLEHIFFACHGYVLLGWIL